MTTVTPPRPAPAGLLMLEGGPQVRTKILSDSILDREGTGK
jgi:hypothetical protein